MQDAIFVISHYIGLMFPSVKLPHIQSYEKAKELLDRAITRYKIDNPNKCPLDEDVQPLVMNKSQRKIYIATFRHFALRLSERYGIFLSFEQYVDLCKIPPSKLRNKKKKPRREHDVTSVYVGLLEVEGQWVKVIKSSSEYYPLITVLPLDEDDAV